MAFDYFYTKQATFTISEYTLDDSGFYEDSEESTVTVNCDVQPLDSKIDIDETGKLIDATYKIFCDCNTSITEDSKCTYDDNDYSVTKITKWDDYYIVYIRAVK